MEWLLIVGPGPRLAELLPVLAPSSDGGDCVRLQPLADLASLLRPATGRARLVLDLDLLPLEDAGLVRLWLRADPARELVLAGDDATRRAARLLLGEPRARWLAWPPDLDDLKRLVRAPGAAAAEARGSHSSPPSPEGPAAEPPTMDALGEELSQIEAILGAPLPRRAARTAAAEASAHAGGPPSPASPARPPVGAARTPARAPEPAPPAATPPRVSAPPLETPSFAAPRAPEHEALEELDELEELHEFELEPRPGPRSLPPSASEAFAPPTASAPRAVAPETEGSPPGASSTRMPAPESAADAPGASSARAPDAPRPPAPYFQHQVADLADLAQRIELGLTQVREGAQASEESAELLAAPLDELTQDVARLLQFTRTLGFLVAAPGPGQQRFDLGELVDVFTRDLVARGAEGPRCLARKQGPAPVRSDRQLVAQALDALFFVASRAAAPGEIVRVKLETDERAARLAIEFPAGPLDGLEPARILEPYALRRVLPELGANALSAAVGILRGQGGALELERKGERHLEWRVRLPLAATDRAAEPSEHDPFA
ncbi:MAG: hypothetical protein IPJ77_12930 [Planctomycetes bacterium]|nr:hypothetical protein [Planctomycetota bacterium]